MFKILLILITPFFLFSQNWSSVTNFPGDGRHHPITFSNDLYGFVVSGSYFNDVFKYDKLNDNWTQLQDFPLTGRGYSYGVSVGDEAFMGFGSTDNGLYPNDWWKYDMVNDSWLQMASFPGDGRNHPAMIVVNNQIFIGCGSNDNGNLGDWWQYDITSNIWSQKSNIIGNNRHHPFYFGIGDYAYIGFGHGSVIGPGSNPSSNQYIYNDFYRYDPINDSWMQLADFPSEARVAGTQFSYSDKGYILSGDGDNHGPLSAGEFWEYNPVTDIWSQLSSHPGDAIWAPGNFVIGCDIFFLLGQDNNSSNSSLPVSVFKYKLDQDCGCIDSLAFNFSNLAVYDDGSCCYLSGCTDQLSVNYDSNACFDDNSCIPAIIGCMNSNASNFNAQANVSSFNGGALDNLIGSGSYFYNDQYLIFSSNQECVIRSCDIYSENNDNITFELRNSNGMVLDDTTYLVNQGIQNIILNFDVPLGSDLQLGVSDNSGLFRNNTGANYPYNIGGIIDVTGSSASQSGYYYFYYNIKVEAKCNLVNSYLENFKNNNRKLVKITDILGKECVFENNKQLFYIYDDGSIENKFSFF